MWSKRFEKPDLSDQDWLEPSDALFDDILAGVDEPKKKNGLWLIPFFIIGFLSAVTLVYLNNDTNISSLEDQLELSKNPKTTVGLNQSRSETMPQFSAIEDYTETAKINEAELNKYKPVGLADMYSGIDTDTDQLIPDNIVEEAYIHSQPPTVS